MATSERENRQFGTLFVAAGTAVLLLGLTLAIGAVVLAVHRADHWRALQTTGTPVQATVERTMAGGTKGTDSIQVAYDFGGRHYEAWTRCAGPTGCRQWPGPQVKIWLDPAHPDDFVKDSENASRWVSVRNSLFMSAVGLAFAALGGVGLVFGVSGLRTARRQRQAAAAGPVDPPRRDGRRLGRRPVRRPRRRR